MTDNESRGRAGRSRAALAGGIVMALLATILLAVAAGCGGGDEEATTSVAQPPVSTPTAAPPGTLPTPPPPTGGTADQYRMQADAICSDQDSQIAAIGEPSSAAELGPYLDRAIPISEASLQQFSALVPSPELATGHGEALALITQQLAVLKSLQATIQGGADPEQAFGQARTQLDPLDQQLEAKAQELGLTVCGRDDDPGSTPPTTDPITEPSGGDAQFARDGAQIRDAFVLLGQSLQAGQADPLQVDGDGLNRSKEQISSAIASMSGYTVSDPQQQAGRQAIVAAGPAIEAGIDGVLSALQSGNPQVVQAAVLALGAAIQPLQALAG